VNAKIVDSILRRSTRAAPILVAYFLLVPGLARSDSSANPPGSAQIDYGMPERLGRQVSPTPSVPWSAPDLRGYTSLLKTAEPSPIDQQKHSWEGMTIQTDKPGTLNMREAMYYTLSRPVSTVIIGCDTTAQLEENVQLARNFTPINEKQQTELVAKAEPCAKPSLFFRFYDRA